MQTTAQDQDLAKKASYLREELRSWETRRKLFGHLNHNYYFGPEMNEALGRMVRELKDLEAQGYTEPTSPRIRRRRRKADIAQFPNTHKKEE